MVEVFYELRNEYIKFLVIVVEIMRCIEIFTDKLRFLNIVGVIDGIYIKIIFFRDSVVDYFSRN